MARPSRSVVYVASAEKELRRFPRSAQEDALFQIRRLRDGKDPADLGPMSAVGKEVMEFRIREKGEAYRVFYVARFEDAVYILHCFQKKSKRGKATPRPNLETAQARYKQMMNERASRA